MRIKDLFHEDKNLVAYRITRLDMEPVAISDDPPGPDTDLVEGIHALQKSGGTLHLPGLGFIDTFNAGLYRIHRLSDDFAAQWIVYDDDPFVFAASIASVFYHYADEPDPRAFPNGMAGYFQHISDALIRGQVPGVCTTSSVFFAMAAYRAGFESVFWEFFNPTATFLPASSHVMGEIRDPRSNKTILVYIDRKLYFQDEHGIALNLLEFIYRSKNDKAIILQKLSNARFAGYGIPGRIGKSNDFLDDLHEHADNALSLEMYRFVGSSPYIFGTRLYGDVLGGNIVPSIISNALVARFEKSGSASIPPVEQDYIDHVKNSEVADF